MDDTDRRLKKQLKTLQRELRNMNVGGQRKAAERHEQKRAVIMSHTAFSLVSPLFAPYPVSLNLRAS